MIFYEQAQSMKWHVRSIKRERERERNLFRDYNQSFPPLPALLNLSGRLI